MKITADTNVLIRAIIHDNAKQTASAVKVLKDAEIIAVPLSCLCEFAWVLRKVYRFRPAEIHASITLLLKAENISLNRPAVEAGLAMLEAGGDFADAVVAFEGQRLGGDTFISFDKEAVNLLLKRGQPAQLLT